MFDYNNLFYFQNNSVEKIDLSLMNLVEVSSKSGVYLLLGFVFGNILNRHYASILGLEKLIIVGSALSVVSYLSMLFMHLNGFLSPLYIAVPVILFGLGNGFTVANCIIGAVSSTGNNSGTATGVAGALQMSSGGVIGILVIFMGGANSFLICLIIINLLCITAFVSSVINYRGVTLIKF